MQSIGHCEIMPSDFKDSDFFLYIKGVLDSYNISNENERELLTIGLEGILNGENPNDMIEQFKPYVGSKKFKY